MRELESGYEFLREYDVLNFNPTIIDIHSNTDSVYTESSIFMGFRHN